MTDADAIRWWRELLANATPGPWKQRGHLIELPVKNRKYPAGNLRLCPSLTYEHEAIEEPNARLIVALVNCAPQIAEWFAAQDADTWPENQMRIQSASEALYNALRAQVEALK